MKKLYRKGTIHPSPTLSSPNSDHISALSYLPTAILTLVAALSTDDKQVLAYLLSSNKNRASSKKCSNNVTCFTCYCFTCYTSYWARWDSSPNRQLIHEIIDALEEDNLLAHSKKNNSNSKKCNKKKKNFELCNKTNNDHIDCVDHNNTSVRVRSFQDGDGLGDDNEGVEKEGLVRKMVSFIWGNVWG